MTILGSHVGIGGSEMMLGSVKEALRYGANAFMIYTGAPQNTRRKDVSLMRVEEAKKLMEESNIDIKNVVVHAPYIMNLANPDPQKHQFAIDFFTEEVKRTHKMGVKQIVLHPGAHLKQGPLEGIERIIKGLNQVIENTSDLNVLIALETMAGKGTEIGRSFQELKMIVDGIENKKRISVCFDTCHTHDAGYDIINDFDGVIEEFDKLIGKELITVFHINDSKNQKGSHKDRHENIGHGFIGFDALSYIVQHKDFKDIPKILETPYVTKENETKKIFPPYKEEISMLKSEKISDNLLKDIRDNNI